MASTTEKRPICLGLNRKFMKYPISSIPQLYRNVRRWTEILSVLSKYGLADWLSRTNIEFAKDRLKSPQGDVLARESQPKRIRLAMTELGPTFIKIGQLLSTRADVVGVTLANELAQLQSDVHADDFDYVKETIEQELGQPLEEVFADFDKEAVASASIGQVHRARLIDGRRVVVKVQHHGISATVNNDLDILAGVAQLAEMLDEFKPYQPKVLAAEMARSMRRELDFGREERNLQQFAALFENDPDLRVPKPVTEYCTSVVLTMEELDGTKLREVETLKAKGVDLEAVVQRIAKAYLHMIFEEGFFHADPHPGNILILSGGVVGLLDFGMVGRINERMRESIEEMLLAIVNRDVPTLAAIIKRVGSVPPNLDEGNLVNDMADFVGQYATQSMDRLDVGNALNDMMSIVRNHQITLPNEAALLIKTLVTLEGTAKLVYADFSLMELMTPFHRSMLLRRLSPQRHVRKVRRLMMHIEQIAEVLPQRFSDILEQIQSGRFDVHLDHRRLGPSVNRLVMGLMTSSLFLGSSIILSTKVPPLLFPSSTWLGLHEVSILGLAGCTLSFLLGFRLFWAIRKSGNLDKGE